MKVDDSGEYGCRIGEEIKNIKLFVCLVPDIALMVPFTFKNNEDCNTNDDTILKVIKNMLCTINCDHFAFTQVCIKETLVVSVVQYPINRIVEEDSCSLNTKYKYIIDHANVLINIVFNLKSEKNYLLETTIQNMKFISSCQPGFFLHEDYCAPCPKGSYNDQYGKTSCELCPLDTCQENVASTFCNLCEENNDDICFYILFALPLFLFVTLVAFVYFISKKNTDNMQPNLKKAIGVTSSPSQAKKKFPFNGIIARPLEVAKKKIPPRNLEGKNNEKIPGHPRNLEEKNNARRNVYVNFIDEDINTKQTSTIKASNILEDEYSIDLTFGEDTPNEFERNIYEPYEEISLPIEESSRIGK